MLYNKEAILDYLPHRDPFLFIDSVESVKLSPEFQDIKKSEIEKNHLVGSEVIAHYRTRKDHPIFEGHFPGNPVLPGVIQVEMMAQASIFMVKLLDKGEEREPLKVALLNVSNAKFRTPLLPEMDLVIKTLCTRIRGNIVSNDCKIFVEDMLVAESSNLATINLEG